MTLTIPAGLAEGAVEIRYTSRKLFLVGDFISLLTLLGILAFFLYTSLEKKRRKKRRMRKKARRRNPAQ